MRSAVLTLHRTILLGLLGLPDDIWVEGVRPDPDEDWIQVVLGSKDRFEQTPDNTPAPLLWPQPMMHLRMLPAPPVSEDEPQHPPAPGDVMYYRFVWEDLPPMDPS